MIIDILVALVLLALLTLSLVFLRMGIVLNNGSPDMYERNRKMAPRILDVLLGKVMTDSEGLRDYKVAAGIAYDVKKKQWVEQGKISTEAIVEMLDD